MALNYHNIDCVELAREMAHYAKTEYQFLGAAVVKFVEVVDVGLREKNFF